MINSELATGRSISSSSFVQSNFAQSEKIQPKPVLTDAGFVIKDRNTFNAQVYSDTARPFSFVIPSYASGILNTSKPTSNLSPLPSDLLHPPSETSNRIPTTTLNSIVTEAITQQRVITSTPVTQRRSSITTTQADEITTTIQPEHSTIVPLRQNTVFSTIVPLASFTPFGAKATAFGTGATATRTAQTTLRSTPTAKSFNPFGSTTQTPPRFNFVLNSKREEVLGNQRPGYAVRPDGSIDTDALPFNAKNTQQILTATFLSTTAKPLTTHNLFESTTKVPDDIPNTTFIPTTVRSAAIHQQNTNFTHNPWLNQFTPNQNAQKPGQKVPFVPSANNPFLSQTTFNRLPTTTQIPFETTTQAAFTGFVSFTNGVPSKNGLQAVSNPQNKPNGNVFGNGNFNTNTNSNGFGKPNSFVNGNGVRDRVPVTTTTTTTLAPTFSIDVRDQFTDNTAKPFNTFIPTTTISNTVTPSFFNNFGEKTTNQMNQRTTNFPDLNTASTFNHLNNQPVNKNPTNFLGTTQSRINVRNSTFAPIIPNTANAQRAQNSQSSQNSLNALNNFNAKNALNAVNGQNEIHVPENDLLPPFDDTQKVAATIYTTVKPLSTFQTTRIVTTLPPFRIQTTTIPTTTRIPTTFPTTIETTTTTTTSSFTKQNELSTIVNKPSQDLLPPPPVVLLSSTTTAAAAVNQSVQLPLRSSFPALNKTTVSVHKSPAITLPTDDLLPPFSFELHKTSTNTVNTPTIAPPPSSFSTELDSNPFLPELDLNPFLPPFGIASRQPTANNPITSTPSTINTASARIPLAESPFDYQRPSIPFIIGNPVKASANANVQGSANTKYTGGFGAPPGILTPYDNLNGNQ